MNTHETQPSSNSDAVSQALGLATSEKGGFRADFGLAGIWQEFGKALSIKNTPQEDDGLDSLEGLEMACKMADDLKAKEKMRLDFVKSYFLRVEVKAELAKHFTLNADKPREHQVHAIKLIAKEANPGMPVNLRGLEATIAEKTPDSITTNYLRNALIPLMQEIGLIVPAKEGTNGWKWCEVDKKATAKERTQKALKQVALLASPVHRELLDEQAKRYALMQQEKVLKQRLMQEKANQQLIIQAQAKSDENEKAMVALGMKKTVNNTPAWIASAAVLVITVGLLAGQGGNQQSMPIEQAAVKTYEDAPDYNAISDEELLRKQYQQAGIDWDAIPKQDRESMIKELQQERLAQGAKQ